MPRMAPSCDNVSADLAKCPPEAESPGLRTASLKNHDPLNSDKEARASPFAWCLSELGACPQCVSHAEGGLGVNLKGIPSCDVSAPHLGHSPQALGSSLLPSSSRPSSNRSINHTDLPLKDGQDLSSSPHPTITPIFMPDHPLSEFPQGRSC